MQVRHQADRKIVDRSAFISLLGPEVFSNKYVIKISNKFEDAANNFSPGGDEYGTAKNPI